MYGIGIKRENGEVEMHYTADLSGIPDIVDRGETVFVGHNSTSFPITVDFCNQAREMRSYWRRVYERAGLRYE